MGIPSFYKHLLQTVGGLTNTLRPTPPHIFALDLNCAIYHCMRKIPISYSASIRNEWETRLIQEVLAYIRTMIRLVQPTQTTYIAVDGVAPMAKIKQQRARRFKSSLLAEEEGRLKAEAAGRPYEPVERWDSNAITPGTEFMRKLTTALRDFAAAAAANPAAILVSPADEAGEGEQKIMAWLRSQPLETSQDVVVYGLDADLIVLSLLEHARSGRTVDLFREDTEKNGAVKVDALGEERYVYMNLTQLTAFLRQEFAAPSVSQKQFLYDYVGAMNFLGNDFVPHGMGLKIHDEGIELVLQTLKSQVPYKPLVNITTQTYTVDTVQFLFETLAAQEDQRILKGIRRKLDSRVGGSGASSSDPEYRAVCQWNDSPVTWAAETCLVEQRTGADKTYWAFRPTWKDMYRKYGLWSSSTLDVVTAYCKTLAWTLDYYCGTPVDMTWYYPWFLPPLFETLTSTLKTKPELLQSPNISASTKPLKPVEQLAMVLPLSSFSLLPKDLSNLPQMYPHAWPLRWETFSLGRRFLWECEPLIPLIQPSQMKQWIEECLDSD